MCHGSKCPTGKTIRYKATDPKHKDAIPYHRPKHKKDYRDYEN